jgi:adenine/guanine phosphoribosyltransferase-like PRPP-binding protein
VRPRPTSSPTGRSGDRRRRLAGERLSPGTPIHLIDDLVFAGRTLRSARDALGLVGLDGATASVIRWTRRADAAQQEPAAAGLTEVTCLIHQSLLPGRGGDPDGSRQ